MNRKDLFCRTATSLDATQIAQVHVDSWRVAYKDLLPADLLENLSVAQRSRMWDRLLAANSEKTVIYVAESGGLIVGFALAGPARETDQRLNQGEIYAIYVDGSAWGSGIGYKLMEASHHFLKQMVFSSMVLWVLDGNEQAIRFYERYGFVRDVSQQGVKIDQFGNVPVRELRYKLTLDQSV
jgi:GNAT superfamily N-acetyltransferase